jgi:hypothetical protein
MQLDLDQQEAMVLKQVLDNYLPELREQVYKTETFELREALKRREEVIKRLASNLEALAPSAS